LAGLAAAARLRYADGFSATSAICHNQQREDTMRAFVTTTAIAALALAACAGIAAAEEVTLISVGGVKTALDPIIADFQKTTGNTVKFTVGSPLAVSKKLADGEAFDVVVQSVPAMDDLAKLHGLKPETRKAVARGGIGIAVKADAAAPDLSTADAFKKALLSAKSIGVGDTAMPNGSGVVIQRILAKSGVMDSIKSKVKVVGLDPGQQMISKGELELGLMNSSEVRNYVKFAGAVPAPLQDYTDYEVAITTKAKSGAAGALADMIHSAGAAKHWTAARMEPQAK
jgi:molybdate transport system substrate-binding protein